MGKSCLEVGSLDVNGNPRTVLNQFAEYVGLDMRPGPCVDVVCKAEEYNPGRTFDVVLCGGTLEHCEDWRGVVKTMKRLVAEHGLVVLHSHTIHAGYHPHPGDYWRFTEQIFRDVFFDFEVVTCYEEGQDVYISARKPKGWIETEWTVEAIPQPQG